jgi:predicted transcriptional regulator
MANASSTDFLEEVESFLREHGLSATRFGVLAAGDTKFVGTLRKGRKLRLSTLERVRQWMKANGE